MAGQFTATLGCRLNATHQVRQWQYAARNRRVWIVLLIGLPLLAGVYFLASRFLPLALVIGISMIAIAVLAFAIWKSSRQLDTAWLIRQLDQALSQLEDSSDLLFKPISQLSTLQNLQRSRVEQRILTLATVDLREAWPKKIIALSLFIGICLSAFSIFWPRSNPTAIYTMVDAVPPPPSVSAPVRLIEQTLSIRAPAYTGVPKRSEKALQVKFPEGSNLSWNLKFQPQPTSVELVFHDGSRLALKNNGKSWLGAKIVQQSSLYRLQVNHAPLAEDKLYRLDAIKDLPPQLRVLQPDRNLSLVELGQTDWSLSFEAEDDYGLGSAQIHIQLAQGSGENIKFSEQTRAITGQGSHARKRFSQTLDLTALGVAAGDDAIVQFSISDQRTPNNNTTRSSSFILRWPPEDSVEATGVEGMVQKAIPAYFRSQRQVIIDTEKLLAERKKYSAENFAIQSDTIGVDQRILRLRYGQFLGEEAKDTDEKHDEHADEAPGKAATANDSQSILEQYGHTHDIPEAATLLEPKTKQLLRAALNEMWQAELHLRSGQPKQALPFENRALAFIKKVQQADRIYLARVGLELPSIDETRRLSGDRSSLKSRPDFLEPANNEDAALIQFWHSLDRLEFSGSTGDWQTPDFKALRNWVREHPSRSPDALGLLAALDALEKKPACKSCLAEMKTQLWPMLSTPPATPRQRVLQNRDGQKYLDALKQERNP